MWGGAIGYGVGARGYGVGARGYGSHEILLSALGLFRFSILDSQSQSQSQSLDNFQEQTKKLHGTCPPSTLFVVEIDVL